MSRVGWEWELRASVLVKEVKRLEGVVMGEPCLFFKFKKFEKKKKKKTSVVECFFFLNNKKQVGLGHRAVR